MKTLSELWRITKRLLSDLWWIWFGKDFPLEPKGFKSEVPKRKHTGCEREEESVADQYLITPIEDETLKGVVLFRITNLANGKIMATCSTYTQAEEMVERYSGPLKTFV